MSIRNSENYANFKEAVSFMQPIRALQELAALVDDIIQHVEREPESKEQVTEKPKRTVAETKKESEVV